MISAQEALKRLKDGNKRFVEGKSIHPNLSLELRDELLSGQKPFAAIIGCSDSRIPIEIVFDAGIGDLFVIRTAGHVLSKEILGSLEYAVKSLGVKLVVILGHDDCGAVKSAMAVYKTNTQNELTENLQALLSHIYPVLDKIQTFHHKSIEEAVVSNIHYQVEHLKERDSFLAQKIANKKIMLLGAKYNLKTGEIDFYE